MSETLPPITGEGVILNFVFPFDDAVERKACICWRRTLGGQHADTEYARVEQSGDTTVVLQQVTFKGDAWVALEENSGKLLVTHVATGEREQRVVITPTPNEAAAPAAAHRRPSRNLPRARARCCCLFALQLVAFRCGPSSAH